MAKKENEVANVNAGAIALASVAPAWLKKGNRGSENVEASDLILPRLGQIQALSPQIKKSDPAYIENAEQGMLFNNITGELLGTSITFIPVLFRKEWVVFKDRKKGGGFFGAFESDALAQEFIKTADNNDGMESIESHNHIGYIVMPSGERQQLVVTCTKSKIKASRLLNSQITMAGVDRFAKAYEIKSVEAQNNAGEDFWNYAIKPLGFVSEEVYNEMAENYEKLKNIAIKTDYSDQTPGKGGSSAADEKEF